MTAPAPGARLGDRLDGKTQLPCHRARRRGGHTHALGASQGAQRDRRPVDARPCARGRAQGRRQRGGGRGGPEGEAVAAEAERALPNVEIFVQAERLGTAHAVLAATPVIARGPDDLLVIFGDTPLVRPQTLARMRAALADGAALVVLGFRPKDATGYGRLVLEGGTLVAIREELDASPAERAIALCNGGLMAFAGTTALAILERIGNANRKGEYYLTDAVAVARDMGLAAVVIETEEDEVRGINTKAQLAEAEAA